MRVVQSILGSLVKLRNQLYDSGSLRAEHLSVPVISVGNVTMGGTGKTPFVLWLIQELKNRNLKLGIVVKSYKAGLKEPRRVTTAYNEARHCGDEAVLIALKNPEVIVWAGPDKTETAKAMLRSHPEINLIVVDDGFQHRKLHRDLDIVLLDASVEVSDYEFPPVGRAREKIENSNRAEVFVLTKLDQAKPETLKALQNSLQKISNSIVLNCEQVVEPIKYFAGQKEEFKSEGSVLGFSGLGNAMGFENSLKAAGVRDLQVLNFKDHQNYDPSLIADIAKTAGGRQVVTTEKDAVKLQDWPLTGPSLFILPIRISVKGALSSFYAKITQLPR